MRSIAHDFLADALAASGRDAGMNLVIPECQRVDRLMVMITAGGCVMLGGEAELSERNALVNVLRNLVQVKCDAVLTICPDERVRNRVAAKLDKHLPKHLKFRVFIFTYQDIQSGDVTKWIARWSIEASAAAKDTKQQKDGGAL